VFALFPYSDHVGDCAPIVDAMPVRLLFDSGQQYDGRAFRDCMREAATHGVSIVRPERGYRCSDDDVALDILARSLPVLADTGDDMLSLRIPANRITAIIAGKRGITADTALRLARYFGTSAEVWMGLQADYDLQTERDLHGAEIERAGSSTRLTSCASP
jgi:plasmid maintenance system antidote protein VapI